MQEELLSAGQFPYFPQGNPGKFLCIYLCSACTVKSRAFWTPRALLSFLKCYSAHRAQPDAWHTGVSAPSLHSMRALALVCQVSGQSHCPRWVLRCPEILNDCPKEPFQHFWVEKNCAVGAVEVMVAWDARGDTVHKSQIKPQWNLSPEDAEKCELSFLNLWFSVIYEPIALQPIQEHCWTTKSY